MISARALFFVVLVLSSFYSESFAEQPNPCFSGQDYLDLPYQQRAEVIDSFIEHGKERDVIISKGPVFYCRKLDAFYVKHSDFAKEALFAVIKTLIIMEYDWDKRGLDKDLLARKWLGEELYQTNKFRFGVEANL